MSTGFSTPSPAEARKIIAEMRKATKEITTSKKVARAFLIKHGFITKDGKLTPQYR